jgi:hypothetical protein
MRATSVLHDTATTKKPPLCIQRVQIVVHFKTLAAPQKPNGNSGNSNVLFEQVNA